MPLHAPKHGFVDRSGRKMNARRHPNDNDDKGLVEGNFAARNTASIVQMDAAISRGRRRSTHAMMPHPPTEAEAIQIM